MYGDVSPVHYGKRPSLQAASYRVRPHDSRPMRHAIPPHISRSLHGKYTPARRTRLVALIEVVSGLLFRDQATQLHRAAMSAFPESGHSTKVIFRNMNGCFRCGLNRSMQHLNSNTREGGVADELPDEEIHHRA